MALRTPFANDAKTYGFEWLRGMLEAALQEGVLNMGGAGTDFKVTAAAAGGMRVDVAAGAALVKGDSGTPALGLSQGLFLLVNDAPLASAATLTGSNASLPRVDQIVLHVYDSGDLGLAQDAAAIEVVTGVASSGATLDNRNGAAALPNDCLRLADVLVPAGSSVVSAGNVRDRRPWARGANWANRRTAGNYVVTAMNSLLDSVNFYPRLEVTAGNVLTMSLAAAAANTVAGNATQVGAMADGTWADGGGPVFSNAPVAGYYSDVSFVQALTTLSAGSHLLGPGYTVSGGTSTILANSGQPLSVHIREHVAANASNT